MPGSPVTSVGTTGLSTGPQATAIVPVSSATTPSGTKRSGKPASHRSTDTSPVEVYARVSGALHWLCPRCNFIHDATHINWRHPHVRCDGRWYPLLQCNRSYKLGLLFEPVADAQPLPPFNALCAPPLVVGRTNRLGRSALAGSTPAVAHINGLLGFICPTCQTFSAERIDWMGSVHCGLESCKATWRVSVLFHPPTLKMRHIRTPRDWSIPTEPV